MPCLNSLMSSSPGLSYFNLRNTMSTKLKNLFSLWKASITCFNTSSIRTGPWTLTGSWMKNPSTSNKTCWVIYNRSQLLHVLPTPLEIITSLFRAITTFNLRINHQWLKTLHITIDSSICTNITRLNFNKIQRKRKSTLRKFSLKLGEITVMIKWT